jgi:hypothetical protein
MTAGRPTLFTLELANEICVRIASGRSLRTICEADDMPTDRTIFRWLAADEKFRQQYALAREAQTEALAEDILEIADDGTNDWMERKHGDSVAWVENGEAIQRSKLRVDSRKWLMSKMAPKKYGDKITQELQNPDGSPIAGGPTIIFTGAPPNTPSPQAMGMPRKPSD